MKQNSNISVITMDIEFPAFMDWFMAGFYQFNDQFNFDNFVNAVSTDYSQDMSISIIGLYVDKLQNETDTALACNGGYYMAYGILRTAYERGMIMEITEKNLSLCNGTSELFENWSYRLNLKAAGQDVTFMFYTRSRFPEFEWIDTAGEWFRATEKPVLCLESKSSLTHEAMMEIASAINEGYYSDNVGIGLNDFDNIYEIRQDWMRYKSGCSDEYLSEQAWGGAGDICDQAIVQALDWFKLGYETGALQLKDDVSCPVLNKLGFEYKMY